MLLHVLGVPPPSTLGSMFNYPGENVHYPGEYVTLGSMFNYPREYVQLLWGVCLLPGEWVQLPFGVCLTTLGSMSKYPGEYVQLSYLGSLLGQFLRQF